jgi:hypothetical protein
MVVATEVSVNAESAEYVNAESAEYVDAESRSG